MKYLVSLLIFLTTCAFGSEKVLDAYVQEALMNNLALKQHDFSLQKSVAALNQARGMFLPSLDIEARFSRAGGGRIIDMPIGDLVNPIYSSLNTLLGQQVYPTNFPNQSIPFLRETEHETKIRLIQPIFQPALFYNTKIHKELKNIESNAKEVYASYIIAEVKEAWFRVQQSYLVNDLYNETEELLHENVRVSTSLFDNGMATKVIVLRAETELADLEQKKAEAKNNLDLAKAYLNFLLNRPLDFEIEQTTSLLPNVDLPDLHSAKDMAIQNRKELAQLESGISIAHQQKHLANAAFLPNLTLVADYGFQGEEFILTEKYDYWMASVIGSWNLFNGFQDKNRVEQAQLEKKQRELQLIQTRKQIELEVLEGHKNVQVSKKSLITAAKQQETARLAFKMIQKKYKQGLASQIEFIDARHAKTLSELNMILKTFELNINNAHFERITAKYPLTLGDRK